MCQGNSSSVNFGRLKKHSKKFSDPSLQKLPSFLTREAFENEEKSFETKATLKKPRDHL